MKIYFVGVKFLCRRPIISEFVNLIDEIYSGSLGIAGLTHVLHMIQHENFFPSNTGIVVYWDFLFPLLMIFIYWLYRREQRPAVEYLKQPQM